MEFLIRLLVNAIAIFVLGWLLPGIEVINVGVALVCALVLALLNAFIKPILIIITIPITIFTLGLFLLVINALMILVADYFIDGFLVRNFWWALLFSLLLGWINSAFAAQREKTS